MIHKKIFFLIFIVILAKCTAGLNLQDKQRQAPEPVEKCTTEVSFILEKSKEGTRSERRDGHVLLGSYRMPDKFLFIQTADEAFCFHKDTKSSYDFGYYRCESVVIRKSIKEINEEDLNRGWYLGSDKKKKTPRCWIFVRWNGGNAFLNPDVAEKVLTSQPFRSIYEMNRYNIKLLN